MSKQPPKNQNINVAVRCRPINSIEKKQGSCSILSCDKVKHEVTIKEKGGVHPFTKTYNFDHVFGPDSLQVDVYKAVVKPVVEEVLTGYNCTIFAYGQTGTGKTFTMEGEKSNNSTLTWEDDPLSGVIPRALHQIFEDLQKQPDVEFSLRVSFMELYNEELFDLLGSSADPLRLRIYEDSTKKGSVIISGLEEAVVRTKDEVFEILQRGTAKRQTAATLMNEMSSRSHSVFSVTIHIKENTLDGEELLKTGKLYLVDLAGSENIGRSGAVDKRAREAGNINQSLLTLGRVITALVEHAPHIPYRESKLTRLLQDSLGGRTKTSIIATISPASVNFEETISTLDYAFRAKNITNRPEVNQKLTKKALLKEYTEEIERLRRDLQASREKNGIYIAEDNYIYLQNKLSQQTDAIQEFEDKISTLTEEMKTLNEMFTDTKEELTSTSEKLVETTENLEETTKELNVTKIDLKETRQDRDEKQFLVHEHVKNEGSLYSEADELMSTVKTTINDVEGLHSKVDRKRAVEEHNENALTVFKGSLTQHVADMKSNINSLDEKKSKFTSQMSGCIDGLVTQQTESLGGVKRELEEIGSFVNQTTSVMLTQQEENQEYLKTFAHVVEKDIEALKAKSVTSLSEIGAKTFAQVDTISEKAAVQAEVVTILHTALQRQEQEHIQLMGSFVDQVKNMMKDFVGVASDYLNKQMKENNRLKEEAETTSQKLAEYDEELLSYVQNITATIQKRNERSVQHTDHVQSYADNHHTAIGSFQTEVMRKQTESIKTTETASNKISDSLKKNNQANMESLNQTHRAFITVEEGCRDLSMLTREFVAESEQIWNESAEGLKKGVDEMISDAMTNYTKAHEVIQSFESEYELKHSSSRNTLNETQDLMKGLLQNQKDLHNHHDSDVARAIAGHNQQLIDTENMCNALVGDKLKKDIPTGCTPQRVVFSYPRSLTKTEQHGKLLEQFRISQQEVAVPETEREVCTTPVENADEDILNIQNFKGSLDNVSDAGSLISIASSGISTFSSISKMSDFDVAKENKPKIKKATTSIKKAPPKTPLRSTKKTVNARDKQLPLRSSNRE